MVRHNPVIEAVRIDPDRAARERILRERDRQRLDRWIPRAAISATLAGVLDSE